VKKLFGMAALAASLSLVGAGEAKAAGPFYLYFADYCDCITLYRGALAEHNWFVGSWDWECLGTSNTLIHGLATDEAILGTRPVDSNGNPATFSATIVLESSQPGSNHAHITATADGLTNVLIADEADYFLRKSPPCPATPNPSGKPRMFPSN